MNWTKEQKDTIETRNSNILVSAAAGSGKTAVLIERIKRLVLEDRIDIDRFLITTFTKATAAEMKARLEKAIREQMEQPGADREFLRRQLSLLPRANISTFHAFAQEVLKRYFYLTDLEPGFRIGDETEVSIMKNEAVDRLFADRFEHDYDAFTQFLRKYSSERSDNALKRNIVELYDQMRSIPHYMDWARERAELLAGEHPLRELGLIETIARETDKGLEEAVELCENAADIIEEAGIDSLYHKALDDAERMEKLRDAVGAVSDPEEKLALFAASAKDFNFNRMAASKDQREAYAEIKKQVDGQRNKAKSILGKLRDMFFAVPAEEYERELRGLYEDTTYLIGLIEGFNDIFRSMKAEKSIIDFDDVMHYAIEILDDDMAAAEYRERFEYILIDEFQDSNMLQEVIVERIARSSNLFMVGDVKQSIYKFRLAEPEIFKRKYELYARESETESKKIDLNSNFRSKRSVTETVNRVFDAVMDDYDENARLRCTIAEEHPGMPSELHIVDGNSESDDYSDYSAEDQLVSELIRRSLGREIYDVKQGRYRSVDYRDIVVISRNRSSVKRLERFLNNEGIPAYGDNDGGYFESVEIRVFVNLLRIIDNMRQDISLISAMRSPVFGFDVKEMASVRIAERDGSFYDAVRSFAETPPDGEEELAERIRDMLDTIKLWKQLKDTVSLEELVRTLLYDTGYFDYCSGLPQGSRRISNLRMLVEKAAQFEQNSHSGLHGFISYIEAMEKNGLSVGEARLLGEGENVVRVMTVHKSKGLEFPVVILTGTGREIRPKGTGSSITMHKDFAIAMPYVNTEGKWYRKTLLQRVIETKKAEEEYEEEVRILYVAMTRAMDQLLLTGTVKKEERLKRRRGKRRSFIEMLYAPMEEAGEVIAFHSADDEAEAHEDERAAQKLRMADVMALAAEKRDDEIIRAVDERLSFVYPYGDTADVKSKYSVTELSKAELPEQHERVMSADFSRPGFTGAAETLTAAQAGTAMHLVMEKLDFAEAAARGSDYIAQTVKRLHDDLLLTDEEAAAVDIDGINAFFRQEPGISAAAAATLNKEREFISLRDVKGADVIVQGIIDCYFEDEDGIVLIDYKNSHMRAGGEAELAERYSGQMRMYSEALEEALDKKVRKAYIYSFEGRSFIPVDVHR